MICDWEWLKHMFIIFWNIKFNSFIFAKIRASVQLLIKFLLCADYVSFQTQLMRVRNIAPTIYDFGARHQILKDLSDVKICSPLIFYIILSLKIILNIKYCFICNRLFMNGLLRLLIVTNYQKAVQRLFLMGHSDNRCLLVVSRISSY